MSEPTGNGLRLTAIIASAEQMQNFGVALSQLLQPGDVVALNGDLGAGKTCVVQGLARGLGVQAAVTSPTFVLMRQYEGRIPLVHVDVYRLTALSDVNDLGDDVLADDCITAIEWGEAIRSLLGDTFLEIDITVAPSEIEPERRIVTITGHGALWSERGEALSAGVAAFPTS
ncbi:MAG: tRNA (adenosine(37)-N6)-threonylcarbamoyltransferase complex ATPase subunit type 1 TsaE [Nitriliruptoraceae bacterium]